MIFSLFSIFFVCRLVQGGEGGCWSRWDEGNENSKGSKGWENVILKSGGKKWFEGWENGQSNEWCEARGGKTKQGVGIFIKRDICFELK